MFLEQQNYNDFWRIVWCKGDWNNEAENSALHHRNNLYFDICSNINQYILNSVLQHTVFTVFFDDMNAALVSIRDMSSLTRLPWYTTLTEKHTYRYANWDCMWTIYISKNHMDGNIREWTNWICFCGRFFFFSLQVHYLSLSISLSFSLSLTHTHTHTQTHQHKSNQHEGKGFSCSWRSKHSKAHLFCLQ